MSCTISLDAMGGAGAPEVVIEGAEIALRSYPDVRFLLFGDESKLRPLVARFPVLSRRATLQHTDEVVRDDEKPSVALRKCKGSSMRLAINAVKENQAQAVVSSGNTGALMAMSKIVLRTLPGINRPAIASLIPTIRGESLLLDMGANVECDAQDLFRFAVMGDAFIRAVLGKHQPTIGILNVGSEDMKGHEEVRAAARLLRETGLPLDFHGFVEGDDIGKGTVDVVVTDGFTGNVALKTAEGIAHMMTYHLKDSLKRSLASKLGYLLVKPALNHFKRKLDPRQHNGAMFLGLDGIAVKSHGSTDAVGFANAIGVAVELVTYDINRRITEEIRQSHAILEETVMAGERA